MQILHWPLSNAPLSGILLCSSRRVPGSCYHQPEEVAMQHCGSSMDYCTMTSSTYQFMLVGSGPAVTFAHAPIATSDTLQTTTSPTSLQLRHPMSVQLRHLLSNMHNCLSAGLHSSRAMLHVRDSWACTPPAFPCMQCSKSIWGMAKQIQC